MPETQNTSRTKKVIAKWSKKDQKKILLDTKLDTLRSNHRPELRRKLNDEFKNEGTFPIAPNEWDDTKLKTVENVRDKVDEKNP